MSDRQSEEPDRTDPPITPEFAEAFGRTVQVLRTHQGWSRGELAKRAGISYSYLSAIENGTKPPSGKIQMVLAGALGVRMHELIAAAEARMSPAGPDLEATRAVELDRALTRRDQRMAMRATRDFAHQMPMPLAAASPERTQLGALTELRELLARMSDDDIEFLLQMARKLAGRG
jgi:transcriptional regulator with XRE-family HTH domain